MSQKFITSRRQSKRRPPRGFKRSTTYDIENRWQPASTLSVALPFQIVLIFFLFFSFGVFVFSRLQASSLESGDHKDEKRSEDRARGSRMKSETPSSVGSTSTINSASVNTFEDQRYLPCLPLSLSLLFSTQVLMAICSPPQLFLLRRGIGWISQLAVEPKDAHCLSAAIIRDKPSPGKR